jgi:very-short-patch-repair endonuclease
MANQRARKLRSDQTSVERRLWRQLRALKSRGYHFRRQVPIDHLIVDFACYSARLVIEVDGGQHAFEVGQRYDQARDQHLRREGFEVLRFWNNEVMENESGVMDVICRRLGVVSEDPRPARLADASASDPPRKGEGEV